MARSGCALFQTSPIMFPCGRRNAYVQYLIGMSFVGDPYQEHCEPVVMKMAPVSGTPQRTA